MYNPNNPAQYLNGIPLEKAVAWFMDKLRVDYERNNFNPSIYPNEKSLIVDGKIPDKLLLECTNPKDSTFLNDPIMLNKIHYFYRVDPEHTLTWVIAVSYANFSDFIKDELNRHGIILIELNLTATNNNLKTVIKRLYHTKLYGLIKRLKPRTKKAPAIPNQSITTITTLTQYSDVACVANPVFNSYKNNNYLHRHT